MSSYQLEPGSILRQGDTLYIVEKGPTPSGDVVVGVLGNRDIDAGGMFDLGDSCPLPTCDGEIVEGSTPRHRNCSEGCLEWIRNYAAAGEECPSHRCDGDVTVGRASRGQYRLGCTECDRMAAGSIRWREAWWPHAKRETLEHLKSGTES